jgi:hypothetical protein
MSTLNLSDSQINELIATHSDKFLYKPCIPKKQREATGTAKKCLYEKIDPMGLCLLFNICFQNIGFVFVLVVDYLELVSELLLFNARCAIFMQYHGVKLYKNYI